MNINACESFFLIIKYNNGYHNNSYHAKHHYSHCLLEKDQLFDGDKGASGKHSPCLKNLNLAFQKFLEKNSNTKK